MAYEVGPGLRTGKTLPVCMAAASLFILLAGGCTEKKSTTEPVTEDQCVGCHASKERLIATATPDTASIPENPGEG